MRTPGDIAVSICSCDIGTQTFDFVVLGVREPNRRGAAADTVSCAAKLAGKQLKGSGQGGCSWLLPKKARGKKLVVVVSVSYQGQSETFSQTFKVT